MRFSPSSPVPPRARGVWSLFMLAIVLLFSLPSLLSAAETPVSPPPNGENGTGNRKSAISVQEATRPLSLLPLARLGGAGWSGVGARRLYLEDSPPVAEGFYYATKPGNALRAGVLLQSFSSLPVTVLLLHDDPKLCPVEGMGSTALLSVSCPSDAPSLPTTTEADQVTLTASGARVAVPFSISVPPGAPPGIYVGRIILEREDAGVVQEDGSVVIANYAFLIIVSVHPDLAVAQAGLRGFDLGDPAVITGIPFHLTPGGLRLFSWLRITSIVGGTLLSFLLILGAWARIQGRKRRKRGIAIDS